MTSNIRGLLDVVSFLRHGFLLLNPEPAVVKTNFGLDFTPNGRRKSLQTFWGWRSGRVRAHVHEQIFSRLHARTHARTRARVTRQFVRLGCACTDPFADGRQQRVHVRCT